MLHSIFKGHVGSRGMSGSIWYCTCYLSYYSTKCPIVLKKHHVFYVAYICTYEEYLIYCCGFFSCKAASNQCKKSVSLYIIRFNFSYLFSFFISNAQQNTSRIIIFFPQDKIITVKLRNSLLEHLWMFVSFGLCDLLIIRVRVSVKRGIYAYYSHWYLLLCWFNKKSTWFP